VATLAVNDPENIQFVNLVDGQTKDAPTLVVQAGDWENGKSIEVGVVFDVFGARAPILTPNDARKLAKWLTRAADALEGAKGADKKRKHKTHYETDDDEFEQYS